MYNETKIYFPFFTTCLAFSIFSKILKKDKQFKLPDKQDNKNTVIIDPVDLLLTQKFNWSYFDWVYCKRKYCEEFLFSTALNYEIVFITDDSLLNKELYKEIDPYGCASYNIYCTNKKDITIKNINRSPKKLIILTNNSKDYNKKLYDNILEVKPKIKKHSWCNFKGIVHNLINLFQPQQNKSMGSILDLTDFLYTVNNSNTKDCKNVLKDFKGKNFFESYEETRKKVFKLRNIFSTVEDYEKRKDEINYGRIKSYATAKIRLDQLQAENKA